MRSTDQARVDRYDAISLANEIGLPQPGLFATVKEVADDVKRRFTEAETEIARHHRDFEQIQLILDIWEKTHDVVPIKAIRSVVG